MYRALTELAADCVAPNGAGEGIRTPDLLITNQLLYRPELRQPKQKLNFSTRRATGAILRRLNGLGAERPSSFDEPLQTRLRRPRPKRSSSEHAL